MTRDRAKKQDKKTISEKVGDLAKEKLWTEKVEYYKTEKGFDEDVAELTVIMEYGLNATLGQITKGIKLVNIIENFIFQKTIVSPPKKDLAKKMAEDFGTNVNSFYEYIINPIKKVKIII